MDDEYYKPRVSIATGVLFFFDPSMPMTVIVLLTEKSDSETVPQYIS